MAVNASFAGSTLTVLGDAALDTIVLSRETNGTLRVNGTNVVIAGGIPTVANTTLIDVKGNGAADTISVGTDDPMPAVRFDGAAGNDTITGGSTNDTLIGGADNDRLTGGFGNDLIIWNAGDGADTVEGGGDSDTMQANGGAAAETFAVTFSGGRYVVTLGGSQILSVGSIENITVNTGGGADTFDASAMMQNLSVWVDGGTGNDTILGGQFTDKLLGGADNDDIDGGAGNDTIDLGSGDDIARWSVGDGVDTINGGSGTDTFEMTLSAASEDLILSEVGGLLRFTSGLGVVQNLDLDDIEVVRINAGNGPDSFLMNNLRNTDVRTFIFDLAGSTPGTADASIDTISFQYGEGDDVLVFIDGNTSTTGTVNVRNAGSSDTVIALGGEGDDSLDAGGMESVAATLNGGEGNDTLVAGGDHDLNGDSGNDLIFASSTIGMLDGGDGIDTIDFTAKTAGISYTMADGFIAVSHYATKFEIAIMSSGADTVTGTASSETMRGNGGNDWFRGFGGADSLDGGADSDSIEGGAGADTLIGGAGNNTLVGGTGSDLYVVSSSTDTFIESANQGRDTIQSSLSFDMSGLANFEDLRLTGTAATAKGNSVANLITGNSSANTIDGGAGADTMEGGDGSDVYIVDSSGDVVTEAANKSTDRVETILGYTLGANLENLTLKGSGDVNGKGNTLANAITGNSGKNSITGSDGNDTLKGGSGFDTLSGGNNDDRLYGGLNNDRLTGGSGKDNFYFDTALDGKFNVDTITDFKPVDDTIRLENAVFTGLATGTLASAAFRANTSGQAQDTSDRIIYETDTGALYFDRDGTGSAVRIEFAILDTKPAITNADFVIV